jgi:hypothetical protein
MRIRMLKRDKGADDGYTVRDYSEGEEYDVSQTLGDAFISCGSAELAGAPVPKVEAPDPVEVEAAAEAEAEKAAEAQEAERMAHWDKSTPPDKYLERYPEGGSADLAKWVLGQTDEKPEE